RDERRLPDPGLARYEHHASLAERCRFARRGERVQRLVALEQLHGATINGSSRRYDPALVETNAARGSICFGVSLLRYDGMRPLPFVTTPTTWAASGFASSRLGPIVPFEPAAARAWHAPQPCDA